MLRSFALLGSSLVVAVSGDIVLFPWTSNDGSFGNAVDAVSGLGNSQPISDACATALNQTVTCDPQMQLLAASGYVISLDGASSSLCSSSCNSSLVSYRNAVTAACGTSSAFDTYPNTWRGDIIYEYFNMVCDKDPSSGEYCPKWLKEQYAANGNKDLENLPDSVLCSHCQINNMRTVQNSIFLGYNEAMVDTYTKIFTKCNANTATAPKPPPQETFPNTSNGANRTCLSGKTYTTKAGDTCHSIALAQSVSEDTLASINDLTTGCSKLTALSGTAFDLCLPQTCETVQTGSADDCWSISTQYNITFAQFMAFNPTINNDCSNLRPNGTVVCISSPDGAYTPVPLPGSNSSWALGEYADDTVPAPGNTAFGTTANCGAYYQVQKADTCHRISLAAKVSVPLFQQINPSIDAACDNLIPNLWYCVHPIYDWNVTISNGGGNATSTTVAPPAPTPTGTTNQCYKWHVIVDGDNCSLLQNTLGVTMAQLTAWNPDLKADCTNLLLGEAYCVQGPSLPSTGSTAATSKPSSTAAPTTKPSSTTAPATMTTLTTKPSTTTLTPTTSTKPSTTTPPSPPSSSATSPSATPAASSLPTPPACAQAYTVQQGDYCSKIWTQFALSETLFRQLNPTLNAACDIAAGQNVCVKYNAPATCYRVAQGDTCSKIWGRFGLTEAQFRALNPWVDAACGLDVGEGVCIG